VCGTCSGRLGMPRRNRITTSQGKRLTTSAKITHLNSLPQGQPQRDQRTLGMVVAMRHEFFGSCTNHGECEAVCPKQIPMEFIGKMNRDLMRALWHTRREPLVIPGIVQVPSADDSPEQFPDRTSTPLQQADDHQDVHEQVRAHAEAESREHAGTRR
jgi:succinate dehydrogenase / fumarate reductase iron-sulfur subunit